MKRIKLATLLLSFITVTSLVGCQWRTSTSSSASSQDTSSSANSDTSSNSGSSSSNSSSSGSSSSSQSSKVELVSIALNKTQTNILLGSTETLTPTFTPNNATDKEVTWSSDDSSIASVENGVVTAKKIGVTNIKVTAKNKTTVFASCQVTVKDNVTLVGADRKHEFVLFDQHKKKDSSDDAGFYDREQSYKVGDDNKFNVKPDLSVVDATTFLPVSASKWTHDFTITAKSNDQAVGEEYFSVVDARECDIKFTQAAVGKTFTISVAPGGVDASRVASLTTSVTVEVVDGYNVYNAKELGYFDTREEGSEIDTLRTIMENGEHWKCHWASFKTANGLDPEYHPASLVFQNDITVTVEDLPANYFYTAEEAHALNDDKAAGSLVDYTFLYDRTIAGDMTVEGNYFDLDLSNIPLVKRQRMKTTQTGEVVSHSSAFKAVAGGDVVFRNINMTGNAGKATSDDDKVLGGGLTFVKGAGSRSLKSYNIIATKFYITYFGEDPLVETDPFTIFELDKVKCYNNYNSFMYNWGSTITASNSLFRSCGGPIIIQDHIYTDIYETDNGLTIDGYAPTCNFVDCTLLNYVSGSEAWFQQFNATAVTSDIKMLSDLFAATGLPKGFVSNEQHEGKTYQSLAQAGKAAFFNFIALNKSGSAEGITAYPACGTVNVVKGDNAEVFNYRQPAYDSLYRAYLAYMAAAGTEGEQAAQQAVMAELAKRNITVSSLEDAQAKIQAYLTDICTLHGYLRALNNAKAPIFDLGPSFDLLSYDGSNTYLQAATNIVAEMQGQAAPTMYPATADQKANMPDYTALYYMGMALIMELTPYVA